MVRLRVVLAAVCTLSLSPAIAETDVYSLSLQELMEVSITSKTQESTALAPGIVNVVNFKEIEQLGARNLRDVLDRLVNMHIVGSNLYPHNRLSIRGVTQTHTDNKVLLLLNGNVLRDANQGGINTDIYNLFPVAMIKKIEIIRGPGSAIYGTNAFSGALNIITFDGEQDRNLADVSVGSFGTLEGTLMLSTQSENFHGSVAINSIKDDGDEFDDVNGAFGSAGTYPMDKEALQLVSSGNYKNLSYSIILSESDQGNVKSVFQFPASVLEIKRQHINVTYEHKINAKWSVDVSATVNDHEVSFDITNSRATSTDSQDVMLGIDIRGNVSDQLNILMGVTREDLEGTIGSSTDFDTYLLGLYAQGVWDIDEANRLVLGGQLNKAKNTDRGWSPRLTYVHQLDSKFTIKLLYGEAFRSPFATDMFLNSPTLQGNPDLRPETIETFDAQISYRFENLNMSATAYHSKHEDLHQREVINSVPTFVNEGEIEYSGIELEADWQFSDSLKLIANTSYQENENDNGVKDSTYNPNIMVKVGAVYTGVTGLSLSVFNSYFSEPSQVDDFHAAPSAVNRDADAYNLLTLNAVVHLHKRWGDVFTRPMSAALYIDNALDEDIYFPSFNRTNVSSFPHHAGRSLRLTLSFPL